MTTQHTDSVEAVAEAIARDICKGTVRINNQESGIAYYERIKTTILANLPTLQAHTSQQVEELTAEITDLKATCFTMDDVQQQVEEAVLQADATGAYHSGYLAGKAEVEEAVRAERSRIYGRLAQMKSVYETMDTGSALVALLGEDIIREVTPNHHDNT